MNQNKYMNIRNAIEGYLSIEERADTLIERNNCLNERCPIINRELDKLECESNLQLEQMGKLTKDSIQDCISLIQFYVENKKAACNCIATLAS